MWHHYVGGLGIWILPGHGSQPHSPTVIRDKNGVTYNITPTP